MVTFYIMRAGRSVNSVTILFVERLAASEPQEQHEFIFPKRTLFLVHGGGTPKVIHGALKLSPYTPQLSVDHENILASGVRARAYALDTLSKLNPENQWSIYTLGHANESDRDTSSAAALQMFFKKRNIASHAVVAPTSTLTEVIEGYLISADELLGGRPVNMIAHLSNSYHLDRIMQFADMLKNSDDQAQVFQIIVQSLCAYPELEEYFTQLWDEQIIPAVDLLKNHGIESVGVSAEDVLRHRGRHWEHVVDSLPSWELQGQHPWQNRVVAEQQGVEHLVSGSYEVDSDSILEYLHYKKYILNI